MSDIILRGLALDNSNRTVTTLPSNLRNLVRNSNAEIYNGATTLSRLDYLVKSSNNKKGSTPINLLDPSNLKSNNIQQKSSKVTKQQLLQGLDDIRQNNKYSSTNQNQSINKNTQVFVPTTYNFIDTDYTSEKLELAIEAIDNWKRKVNTLNSLVTNANGQIGIAYKNSIISNADKLNVARQEAIIARQEAIIAYKNAIKEMIEIGNYSPSKYNQYRKKYDIMEFKFEQVKQEDKSTMDKVRKFLKEGFNVLLDYANPFNY